MLKIPYFILAFGIAGIILEDNPVLYLCMFLALGGEYENNLFYHLERQRGVRTHYHSQDNSYKERFYRTLLFMLRALPEEQITLRDHLKEVVYAYNCTRNDSTGFSLFYLVFGKNHQFPTDILFGLKLSEGYSTYQESVKRWRGAMREAYEKASIHSRKNAGLSKVQYDKNVRHTPLNEEDRVLVRNLTEPGGPGKLPNYSLQLKTFGNADEDTPSLLTPHQFEESFESPIATLKGTMRMHR